MSKLLLATLSLASILGAETMTGWISDSACGAANASGDKGARDCAAACIKGGHKAVFVTEKGDKVYQLSDSAKAAKFLEKKVKVSGKINGNMVELESISYVD